MANHRETRWSHPGDLRDLPPQPKILTSTTGSSSWIGIAIADAASAGISGRALITRSSRNYAVEQHIFEIGAPMPLLDAKRPGIAKPSALGRSVTRLFELAAKAMKRCDQSVRDTAQENPSRGFTSDLTTTVTGEDYLVQFERVAWHNNPTQEDTLVGAGLRMLDLSPNGWCELLISTGSNHVALRSSRDHTLPVVANGPSSALHSPSPFNGWTVSNAAVLLDSSISASGAHTAITFR